MDIDEIGSEESKQVDMGGEAPPAPAQPQVNLVTEVALEAIGEIEKPDPKEKLEVVITEPLPVAERVTQAASRTFPDPERESLHAIVRIEELRGAEIAKKEKEANGYMATVDKLLDLTAELAALPEEEKVDFTDKIKEILTNLKSEGIDLWKDEETKKIARSRVGELKSLVSSQTDKANKKVQLVLTKMQSLAQDLMAYLESGKGIHRDGSRAKATFTRNQRVGA